MFQTTEQATHDKLAKHILETYEFAALRSKEKAIQRNFQAKSAEGVGAKQ
jgi:hypothetical protein